MSTTLDHGRRRAATAITLAAVAATVLGAGSADAAQVTGTIVAKDAAKGTVVTVSRTGTVRTVRTTAARSLAVGRRITLAAVPRADGTFVATGKVRRLRSQTQRARFRATVVQRTARRLLLSAGGSTFALRRTRAARAAHHDPPDAGDIVLADVRFDDGRQGPLRVEKVGTADLVEIEGVVVDLANGVLRLDADGQGVVRIAVPDGQSPTVKAGDRVEVIASVAADRSFTLVALAADHPDDDGHHGTPGTQQQPTPPTPAHQDDPDEPGEPPDGPGDDDDAHEPQTGLQVDPEDGDAEIHGVIHDITADSVTVTAGPDARLTCKVPAGVSLAGFEKDEPVELDCDRLADGTFAFDEMTSKRSGREVEAPDRD